jgi:alanine racemase
VRGLFSHLANTSPEEDAAQLAAFLDGAAAAERAGLSPEVRHLASTAAALRMPDARLDMVRLGIGIYGIPPFGDGTTAADLGVRPAMTLRGSIAAVRRVEPGTGASYGYAWRAPHPTTLALVPLGYADGVPRQASGRAAVAIRGIRHRIVGRIAMDQFLVDVGDVEVAVGDEVVLFGDPATGAPSADDWGDAADTIGYEIVTRIGPRVPRTHVGTG